MQSKQHELSLNVLCKLETAGVLPNLVLVGSWCLVLYRDYFKGVGTVPSVHTRDMDFLVPSMVAFHKTTDPSELRHTDQRPYPSPPARVFLPILMPADLS